ncbi:MAG: pyrroline-5-carboxylate reductase [Roseburia sp.]
MGKKIGFIGCGNMARAIIAGIVKAGLYDTADILASNRTEPALAQMKKEYGIHGTTDNRQVAEQADILFLCVKPDKFAVVIPQIRDVVKEETVIVSIAAGQTIHGIEEMFGRDIRLVRIMPNTPALVGEAMSSVSPNAHVSGEELAEIKDIFDHLGKAEIIDEKLIDAVVGVSGSSPAYVYMFIEAMADAAVAAGMPRAQAYKFAAQSVLGSAKMVLETGKHPGELKDMVCSPGGTTIDAVCELEAHGFRDAVIAGTSACIRKSREMSQKK